MQLNESKNAIKKAISIVFVVPCMNIIWNSGMNVRKMFRIGSRWQLERFRTRRNISTTPREK